MVWGHRFFVDGCRVLHVTVSFTTTALPPLTQVDRDVHALDGPGEVQPRGTAQDYGQRCVECLALPCRIISEIEACSFRRPHMRDGDLSRVILRAPWLTSFMYLGDHLWFPVVTKYRLIGHRKGDSFARF